MFPFGGDGNPEGTGIQLKMLIATAVIPIPQKPSIPTP